MPILCLNKNENQIIDKEVPLANQLSFSADGTRITYQPKDEDYHKNSLKTRLVSRDLNGGHQQILAVGRSSDSEPEYFEERSLSPDGKFAVIICNEKSSTLQDQS